MKIKIKRFHPHFEPPSIDMEYEVDNAPTLLDALLQIKRQKDRTLTFDYMCRSGVCGSCAVKVDGKEVLSCQHTPKDGEYVEPLSVVEVIRDLSVRLEDAFATLERSKAYPLKMQKVAMSEEDEKLFERQSDCILCSGCFSSCPVYESNEAFLGPFALTRVWRYVADKREEAKKEHIDAVVHNGIWDCTLCGNCTEVCPQGIDPKNDIMMLQSKAAQFGYQNPNLGGFGSFGLEF